MDMSKCSLDGGLNAKLKTRVIHPIKGGHSYHNTFPLLWLLKGLLRYFKAD